MTEPRGYSNLQAPDSRAALLGLSLSMLLSSLGTSIANVALPTLAREFSATFQEVQWVMLAYLLAITTLIVSVGRWGDLTGRKRLLLAGIGLFTTASLLSGLSPTLGLLIAARLAQGAGAAVMMVLTLALVSGAVPKENVGRAMGLLGTTSAIGTALGPSLGGALISGFGWRAIFLVQVPLGAVSFFLTRRCLPLDSARAPGERSTFDRMGTLLLAFSLTAYALAMTLGRGHFGGLNLALLVAALGGLGLFLAAEAKAPYPLIQLALFRSSALSGSLVMSGLVSTVLMATLVVGPFYLSRALGLDATRVGMVMSVGPFVAALTGVPAGRLVDRFDTGRVTICGLAAVASGSLLLALVPTRLGIPGYIAPLALVTAGYALFQTANNTGVMKEVRHEVRGLSSGLLNLSRNLGLITGASVMGAVFTLASGARDMATAEPEATATGMRFTFGVATTLAVIALGVALRLGSRGPLELPAPRRGSRASSA
jgi:EmrB/QacA subfamily drug resistance transporter